VHPYRWSWDADAIAISIGLAGAYLIARPRWPGPRWRLVSFMAGCVLLLAVQLGPEETLALHYLLMAHLLQNVVIAEWGPLLIVLGLTPGMAQELERFKVVRFFTHPLVALPLWLAAYDAWHVPYLYDAALRHQWTILHLEHATYFTVGCLLWWPVFHGRWSSGVKAVYVFGAFAAGAPLGLLLALLPRPVYHFYAERPPLWVSHLADQQIAGVTMASEQAVVFFAVFAIYLLRFFQEEGRADTYRVPTA
jgi:cytochrome c oxidase assembly factor CtaG